MKTDVAIIGAGPAGIAAAVQLKRYGIKCLLFEKDRPGGLLKNAHRVENYPGFPRGITGPQLAELLREHLEVFRITPVIEAVEGLEYWETENCYLITTGESVYQAKIVVSACGTAPVIPEEAENLPTAIRK
ncbi:MAG: NAD(P)/FAD-dependent oxidoreductase, partial [bacterium]|nr:NAD(P)/FAD-dependent oxidoreductase [bacterium]